MIKQVSCEKPHGYRRRGKWSATPELNKGSRGAIALAGLLVADNFAVARQLRARGGKADLERAVLAAVDFVARRFPPRL